MWEDGGGDSASYPIAFRAHDQKRPVALLQEQAGETYILVTFSACGPFGP